MSFPLSIGVTFVRAVLVVVVAIPLCRLLTKLLHCGKHRTWKWSALLLPLIAPRMLTGFGYANFSLSLVGHPFWNELFYACLLLFLIVPVGTALRYFAPPPPIGDEAQHLSRLAGNVVKGAWWRGPASQYLASAGLMFLLAFQEFELASLLGVHSWTVWLFDAQTSGLILSESLKYAIFPVLCEISVLGYLGYLVYRNRGLVGAPQARTNPMDVHPKAGWCYLTLSCFVFCIVPWCLVGREALGGISQLTGNFAVGRDILAGCVFAFLATALAHGMAGWLTVGLGDSFVFQGKYRHIRSLPAFITALGLPGLLGSLVLGLTILFVFQLPPLQSLYGTPFPWLLGSCLFLAPRAILVFWIFAVLRTPEAQHLARLMAKSPLGAHRFQSRELQWRMTWWPHYVAFAMLFFWSYSELTLASILAPPGIVTAPVRLYNLMHYGQSAVLCATTVASFGIPTLIFGLGIFFRRPIQRFLLP